MIIIWMQSNYRIGQRLLHIAVSNLQRLSPKGVLARHIQNQAVRSSTSVAANYRAACLAHSKAAFASKISIVIEEVDETAFWIEFLVEEGILSREKCEKLLLEAEN
ncbi:MAG: four helix bundle protein [Planctomycetota bacterium]